ncbi:hypothetical protein MHU86_14348 [Fragilaria crotonensis]|nr:hypothetical protein MHU86_14348 [Fragilaria crotonensis]
MILVQHPAVSIVKKKRPAGLLRRKFSWMNKRPRVLLRKGDDSHPIDDGHKISNVTIAGTDSETLDAAPSNEDRDIENHKSSVPSSTEDGAESQCQDCSQAVVGSNKMIEYGQHDHHNDRRDDLERQNSNDHSDDHCEHRDDAQDSNRHVEPRILIDRIAVLEGELERARRQHEYIMEQQKRQRQRDKRRAMQEARREVRENSHELKGLLENLEQEMALTVERVRQDCQRHHELDLILALEKERLKLKAEHDSVLQDLTTAFENERSQLKAEHDANVQDITAAFEKERSQLKTKHDAILKKATGALKTELVAFKREASQKWQEYHQEQMDRQGQLQNEHKEQLSALERDAALMWEEHYLDQVEQLLQDQRDQILATRPKTSQEVEELLQHLDVAHQNELVELQMVHHKRLEAQMLEHEKELEEIRRMLQVNSELLERSRKEMKTEKDLAVKEAVKEAVRKANQSFQKEMRLLVVNHSQSVDKLCQRHQEDMQEQRLVFEVERLNDREQAMHEKLALVQQHKRQIQQLGLDHEHELGRLRSEHENVLEDLENKRLAECNLLHSQHSLLRQQPMDESLRNLREERDQNIENRDLDVLLEYCASSIEIEINRTIGGPIAVLEKKNMVHGPVVENQSCSLSNVGQEISCANTEHCKQFCALKATQREPETQDVHASAQAEAVEASSCGAHVIEGLTDEEVQKIENINRVRKL